MRGAVGEALRHYEEAARTMPNNTDPLLRAANLLWGAEEGEGAREVLLRARSLLIRAEGKERKEEWGAIERALEAMGGDGDGDSDGAGTGGGRAGGGSGRSRKKSRGASHHEEL